MAVIDEVYRSNSLGLVCAVVSVKEGVIRVVMSNDTILRPWFADLSEEEFKSMEFKPLSRLDKVLLDLL